MSSTATESKDRGSSIHQSGRVSTPELVKSCQQHSSSTDRRTARLHEKEELIELNDRLASYINKVRSLETENVQLKTIVDNYNTCQESKLNDLRDIYGKELNEVRMTLDDVSRDRARLEIDLTRLKSILSESETKSSTRAHEVDDLQKQVKGLTADNADLKSKMQKLLEELKWSDSELKKQRALVFELEQKLAKIKAQLENETLLRVDSENRNLSLTEELEFLRKVSEHEIDKLKKAANDVANISSQMDKFNQSGSLQYDDEMRQRLQEVRQETEEKLEHLRAELEDNYRRRSEDLEHELNNALMSSKMYKTEVDDLRLRVSQLCTDRDHLNTKLAGRDKALLDLEQQTRQRQQQWEQRVQSLEEKLRLAHSDYQSLNEDYSDLLDLKVTLDQEIDTYRRLVESEEDRLKIPSRKRRRVESIDDTDNNQICSLSVPDQHCILLKNLSGKQISIGGWTIKRSDQRESIEYKFPRNTIIDNEIKVYSYDAPKAIHEPPTSFVMVKGKQWPMGSFEYTTELFDIDNKLICSCIDREIATSKIKSDKKSKSSSKLFGIF